MIKNCRNCKHLIQSDEYIEIWDDGGEFIARLDCGKSQDLYIDEQDNGCKEWEEYTGYSFNKEE